MQRYRLPCLFFFTLVACTTPHKNGGPMNSESPKTIQHEVVPFTGSLKIHRYLYPNGLRLLISEDHSSPTFAYQTWYRVGSRDEELGKTGLAHLFEHMMFKETKHLKEGEFDKILEKAGAEGENAFTSRNYTAYIQELPSSQLDLIAGLEASRMVDLVINQKSFDTEREVVQNERRFRNENSPDGLMDQELFSLAFKVHPNHWPVIGWQEDLTRMSVNDALSFYRNHYKPENATVIIAGDVDPEATSLLIQKHYGSLTNPPFTPPAIPKEPEQSSPKRKKMNLNIQVEKLFIGYRIPEIIHPDIPALSVLQAVLAGGKSSRLHRALVDTGIASQVESFDLDDKDPSLLTFIVNLQKGKHAAQAETALLNEIAHLAKAPPSSSEMERAKNRITFNFYDGLDSNYEKAVFLGRFEALLGDFQKGLHHYEAIQSVTADEVQRVAKTHLDPKNRTVISGAPK